LGASKKVGRGPHLPIFPVSWPVGGKGEKRGGGGGGVRGGGGREPLGGSGGMPPPPKVIFDIYS